jgi:hypothetical protein
MSVKNKLALLWKTVKQFGLVLPAALSQKAQQKEPARDNVLPTAIAHTTYVSMTTATLAIFTMMKKAQGMVIIYVPNMQTLLSTKKTLQHALIARVNSNTTHHAQLTMTVRMEICASQTQTTLARMYVKAKLALLWQTVKQFGLVSPAALSQKAQQKELARANVLLTASAHSTCAWKTPATLAIFTRMNTAQNMATISVPIMQTINQVTTSLENALQASVNSNTTSNANLMMLKLVTMVPMVMSVSQNQMTIP